MTNGERIRNMSDQNLAELIDKSGLYEENYCKSDEECDKATHEERRKRCPECIRKWLSEEE